jgi:ribosomal protein S18 acetylase RimI-like enzyme
VNQQIPHIRIATSEDIEALCQIGAKTFVETYGDQNTPENLRKYLEEKFNEEQILDEIKTPKTIFLLVELENQTIGYAKMRLNLLENPDPKALEIERIYIEKAFHGQKFGAILMQKCMDVALENGYQWLWLGVWEHNPKALSFYKKWGFEQYGEHIFQLGDDAQTDYLMKKNLTMIDDYRIEKCEETDFDDIYEIINDASIAYKGIIPADRWHEPYMSREELKHQIEDHIEFWGFREAGQLLGVMGIQHKEDVTLIRHAYVRTVCRSKGIGGKLLAHLCNTTNLPVLIGTWADATWAIEFYKKYNFRLLETEEKNRVLLEYWTIPTRQVETSVVLASPTWLSKS